MLTLLSAPIHFIQAFGTETRKGLSADITELERDESQAKVTDVIALGDQCELSY